MKLENIEYIFFDCMETLIDLTELPARRDYALWAYIGSGMENSWNGFEEFYKDYNSARSTILCELPEYGEYELYKEFDLIVNMRLHGCGEEDIKAAATSLYNNYWKTYVSKCYIKEDVRNVLPRLKEKYHLGVVSNFMVAGGIEELLEINGIIHHFDFIVTSVNEGWRKPHAAIYNAALNMAGKPAARIVFVGDDYVNDYVTPKEMGMKPLLLDRYKRYCHIPDRVCSFYELAGKLPGRY